MNPTTVPRRIQPSSSQPSSASSVLVPPTRPTTKPAVPNAPTTSDVGDGVQEARRRAAGHVRRALPSCAPGRSPRVHSRRIGQCDSRVSRTESERRVVRLDGVRAIAALSVACFHVWLYRSERPRGERTELLDQVLFHASTGLICFFVLSGYLLYGPFARAALTGSPGVAVGPYLRRRAARIVPAYWLCGAGCLVLYAAVGYHAITPSASELPLFALFLQNYSLATMGRLNPVMWTLGVEVAFYVLLPLVGWLALRLASRGVRAQVLLVVGVIAISPAWNVLALALGWEGLAHRALPAWLGCFGLGMLVAIWVQRRGSVADRPAGDRRAGRGRGGGRRRRRDVERERLVAGRGDLRRASCGRASSSRGRAPRRRRRLRAARRRRGCGARARPSGGSGGARSRRSASSPTASTSGTSRCCSRCARPACFPRRCCRACWSCWPSPLPVAAASWRFVERPLIERSRAKGRERRRAPHGARPQPSRPTRPPALGGRPRSRQADERGARAPPRRSPLDASARVELHG